MRAFRPCAALSIKSEEELTYSSSAAGLIGTYEQRGTAHDKWGLVVSMVRGNIFEIARCSIIVLLSPLLDKG
jgi:hypothetical protein